MTKRVEIKQKVGRKSKYRPSYCEKLIKYFSIPKTREVEEQYMSKNGNMGKTVKIYPNPPPTFAGFAASIFTTDVTLQTWKKEHPEFLLSWGIAKNLQHDFIVANTMTGLAPASFAKFMMQNNHGWSEKTETKTETKIVLTSSEIENLSVDQVAEELRNLLN
jgi:hypothetical protein